MKSKAFVASIIVLLLNCFSCKETPTADGNGNGDNGLIVAEDIGVTDVLLKINMPEAFNQRTVTLKRDTVTILNKAIFSRDTFIVDEGLLPRHTYIYTITFNLPFGILEHSTIDVTTMDTTSHDFTWEIDTLGDGNSSLLYDVIIINDTLAYAVGEIYKKDSAGQFEATPYNAAIWDGKKWNFIRIQFRLDYGTSVIYSYMGIKTVFAISPDDIWFVHHVGGVTRFNDGRWMMMDFKLIDGPGDANKIWGTSSSNLYFVGSGGRIVRYNGSGWQTLESGTGLNLLDIYGCSNEEIYVSGGDYSWGQGVILKYDGVSWGKVIDSYEYGSGFDSSELFKTMLYGPIDGIWSDGHGKLYTVGELIFQYAYGKWRYAPGMNDNRIGTRVTTRGYTTAIRGIARNNIVMVGQQRTIIYYNGFTWQQIGPRFESGNSFNLYGVAMSERMFVGVGTSDGIALAVRFYKK